MIDRHEDWLTAYVDGELSGEELAQAEQQLAQDPQLQARVAELRHLGDQLRRLPTHRLGPEFARAIRQQVEGLKPDDLADAGPLAATDPPAEKSGAKRSSTWYAAVAVLGTLAATLLVSLSLPHLPKSVALQDASATAPGSAVSPDAAVPPYAAMSSEAAIAPPAELAEETASAVAEADLSAQNRLDELNRERSQRPAADVAGAASDLGASQPMLRNDTATLGDESLSEEPSGGLQPQAMERMPLRAAPGAGGGNAAEKRSETPASAGLAASEPGGRPSGPESFSAARENTDLRVAGGYGGPGIGPSEAEQRRSDSLYFLSRSTTSPVLVADLTLRSWNATDVVFDALETQVGQPFSAGDLEGAEANGVTRYQAPDPRGGFPGLAPAGGGFGGGGDKSQADGLTPTTWRETLAAGDPIILELTGEPQQIERVMEQLAQAGPIELFRQQMEPLGVWPAVGDAAQAVAGTGERGAAAPANQEPAGEALAQSDAAPSERADGGVTNSRMGKSKTAEAITADASRPQVRRLTLPQFWQLAQANQADARTASELSLPEIEQPNRGGGGLAIPGTPSDNARLGRGVGETTRLYLRLLPPTTPAEPATSPADRNPPPQP